MTDRKHHWLALAGLAGTSLFWGGNALVARAVHDSIPPLALSFWRWALCGLLMLPWMVRAWQRHRAFIRRHMLQIWILSLTSVAAFNSLLYLAAQHTTAINITLVNTLMPLATVLCATLLLGHRLSVRESLAIVLGFAGVLVVITEGELARVLSLSFNRGDLIMALAMLSWSLYSVLLKKWPMPLPHLDLLAVLVAFGLLQILPFYLWELSRTGPFALTPANLMALGYVAIFPSLLAYAFWNYGVAVAGPGVAAMFSYVTPLLAAALAVPFLGESLLPAHYVGGALLFAGLRLSQTRRPPQGPTVAKP
ncbi:DMT family transporter [Hahella sp. SMD15-11]|uniref:DMT family transporter n=1 Tax=Thermohahella caldifontis TaxID=3142973 RepID=A0AB39UZE0_9GAMM